MKCREWEALYLARSEERLDPQDQTALDEHLGSCARCARLTREMERLEAWLQALGQGSASPPPSLKPRILARLEAPRRSRLSLGFLTSHRLLTRSMECVAVLSGLLVRVVPRVNRRLAESSLCPVVSVCEAPHAEALPAGRRLQRLGPGGRSRQPGSFMNCRDDRAGICFLQAARSPKGEA